MKTLSERLKQKKNNAIIDEYNKKGIDIANTEEKANELDILFVFIISILSISVITILVYALVMKLF